jgi:hypothetical protein
MTFQGGLRDEAKRIQMDLILPSQSSTLMKTNDKPSLTDLKKPEADLQPLAEPDLVKFEKCPLGCSRTRSPTAS